MCKEDPGSECLSGRVKGLRSTLLGGAEICHWAFTAKTKDDRSVKLSEGLVSCWFVFEDHIVAGDGSTSSERVKDLGSIRQVR
jgi:hypothetical protein